MYGVGAVTAGAVTEGTATGVGAGAGTGTGAGAGVGVGATPGCVSCGCCCKPIGA